VIAAATIVVVIAAVAAMLVARADDPGLDASATSTTARPTTTEAPTTSSPTTTTLEPVAPSPGHCPSIPARRTPDPDRPRYTVRVDADPATGEVVGDVTIRFTPDLPVDELVLRLWANAPRPAQSGAHIDAGPPTSEGAKLEVRQPDPTTLEVMLPRRAAAGRVVEVSLPFTLTIPGPASDRISRSEDTLRAGSFVPLLAWEPGAGWSREPPTSAFAEAASSPAADWSVAVSVPAGYTVLASGARGSDGRWAGSGMRDFAMSIGRFAIATMTAHAPGPVEVTVGARAGANPSSDAFARRAVAALEDLARRFGPYPWPTYTLAITPGLDGGIEFPSHVMQGAGTIGRTTPHEAAHQWFYGLVGNNQGRDPWLDEGLASYAEARVDATLASFQEKEIPADGRGHANAPMAYWEPRQGSYYRSVYVQPVQALASLGAPDLVDCALALYAARNAFRIATPEDLLTSLTVIFPDAAARLAPYGLP
jgi:hypothetical protein